MRKPFDIITDPHCPDCGAQWIEGAECASCRKIHRRVRTNQIIALIVITGVVIGVIYFSS